MLFSRYAVYSLLLAMLAVALMTGCPGKEPISATNSGLRPADESEPASDGDTTDGEEPSADGDNDGTAEPSDPIDKPPTSVEPAEPANNQLLEVPEGTTTELVQYLDDVNAELRRMLRSAQVSPPSLEERDAFMARFTGLIQAQLTASKKILDDPDAEAKQRSQAAQTVLDAFVPLAQVGEEEAAKQAREIALSLADDDDPLIRRQVAGLLVDEEIGKMRAGEVNDAAALLKQMEVVFTGTPDEISMARFMTVQSAAQHMLRNDKHDQAVQIMQVMGNHFVDAEHEQLAQAGQDLLDQAKIIQLDSGVRKLDAGIEGAEAELLASAEALLSAENVDSQTMYIVSVISAPLAKDHPETRAKLAELIKAAIEKRLAAPDVTAAELLTMTDVAGDLGEAHAATATAAREALLAKIDADFAGDELEPQVLDEHYSNSIQAEYRGNFELSQKIRDALTAALDKIADEGEREAIKSQLDAAQTRANLIGKPFTVEGSLLDGKPFDWAPYKGKVVLIDVWATWCGPCLEEIPNILENYEKYHDHGFEVVGVNVDDDPADVVDFFARQGKLPWDIVVSNDPDAVGTESPMAKKCGVPPIPLTILIGRDGLVETLHLSGPELGERLAEIFGDVETPPDTETPGETETPAEPDAPEKSPAEDTPAPPEDKPESPVEETGTPDSETPPSNPETAPAPE